MRSSAASIENTYTFDFGIPVWAETYPGETLLLGKPMSESEVSWIPQSAFEERSLVWEDFKDTSARDGVRVIDARDNIQKGVMTPKAESALTPEEKSNLEKFRRKNSEMLDALSAKSKVIAQPFDILIKNIIGKEKLKDQTLLIFDDSGIQVKWLMYHLETTGYKDYYFLSGGTAGVLGIQAYGRK